MAILSIQSHVAYGHVGNSAVTLPLQRLGREVWAVPTVVFAAHAGYGPPKGAVLPVATVDEMVRGIEERGVFPRCKAVLSGYLGDADLGEVVLDAAARVRAANPDALYCCDPVMGDAEPGVYVRAGIPEFLRDRAIPTADIATPNVFELELLTGHPIRDLDGALAACRALIARGPRLVLLTSLKRAETPAGTIEMLVATRDAAWLVGTPEFDLDPAPNGAGDLTAALFLAFMLETRDPEAALSRAASAIHAVFDETRRAGTRELALVAAQGGIVDPPKIFDARRV